MYDVDLKLLVILPLLYHLSLIIADQKTGTEELLVKFLFSQVSSQSASHSEKCRSMLGYCHMFTIYANTMFTLNRDRYTYLIVPR